MIALLLACAPGPAVETAIPNPCTHAEFGGATIPDDALWVDDDAADDGTGAADAPFGTIAAALDVAEDGDTIAIEAGSYTEQLRLAREDFTVVGRCSDLVTIDGTGMTEEEELVRVVSNNITFAGASLVHSIGYALRVKNDGARITDVHISESQRIGAVFETAGEATLVDLVVEGLTPTENFSAWGIMIDETRVNATGLIVSDIEGPGVFALNEETVFHCEACAFYRDEPAIWGLAGATIEVMEGTVISESVGTGIMTGPDRNELSTLTIQDSVLSDTRSSTMSDGSTYTTALSVAGPANASVTGTRFTRNSMNISLTGSDGAEIEFVGEDLHFGPGLETEWGVHAVGPMDVTLSDSVIDFEGAGSLGIVAESGAEVTVTSTEITGISDEEGGALGAYCGGSAVLTLKDVNLHDIEGNGVYAKEGCELTVRDSTISALGGVEGSGITTSGVIAGGAGPTLLDGVTIENFAGIGFMLIDGEATVRNSVLRDIRDDGLIPAAIAALAQTAPMELHIDDTSISDVQGIGVWIVGTDALAVLDHVDLSDIRAGEASVTLPAGILSTDAEIELDTVSIARVQGVGLFVYGSPDIFDTFVTSDSSTWPYIHGNDVSIAEVSEVGIYALQLGIVVLDDVDIMRTGGPGLVASGSYVSCDGCDVSDTRFAGAWARDAGILELDDTTFVGVEPSASVGGGFGIGGVGSAEFVIHADGVAISDVAVAGVYAEGPGEVTITNSVIEAGAGYERGGLLMYGNAIFATGGMRAYEEGTDNGLLVTGNELLGGSDPTILLANADGDVCNNTFTGGSVDVVWQEGEGGSCADAVTEDCADGVCYAHESPGTFDYSIQWSDLDISSIVSE